MGFRRKLNELALSFSFVVNQINVLKPNGSALLCAFVFFFLTWASLPFLDSEFIYLLINTPQLITKQTCSYEMVEGEAF